MRSKACVMLDISVVLDLRNFLRAGMLKKRFSTRKLLPLGHDTTSCSSTFEALMTSLVPTSSSSVRVCSVTCATAAMEASASPRNPIVCRLKRSLAWRILEVAWRSKDRRASVSDMPRPLSMTCMEAFPASVTSTFMFVAPASMAFSTSSFMTDAGRCITSPAAIWFATESGSSWMMSILLLAFRGYALFFFLELESFGFWFPHEDVLL